MADDDWAPAAASPLAEVTGTGPRPARPVQVAGYAELEEVARGGDSIVYRARQVSVDRHVAIKVMQTEDPADVARFERELAITVRLGRQHPHVVTVLDTTTTAAGQPCLVMEFHDLGSLHDRLRAHGPLPVSDVVAAGTAVADALAFAHAQGILHRDVKPQNVLLLPTSYVLSDFGIARMADAGHTATLERFSYRHASPQVLDGLAPVEADDVWSLGSTLFTLLDGRAPFAALDPADDTALSYLRRVRTSARRPLLREDVPPELAALVEACLAPEREDRLGTAQQALRWLRRIRTEDRSWDPAPATLPEVDVATRPRGGSDGSGSFSGASHASPVLTPEGRDEGREDGMDDGWAPASSAPRGVGPGTPRAAAGPSAAEPAPPPLAAVVPAPVAPSALAHIRRTAPGDRDDDDADVGEHTGLAPVGTDAGDDGPGGPGRPAPEADVGADRPTTWRRVVAFLAGVLLVGAAIGTGSAVVRGMTGGDPTPDPVTTGSTIPQTQEVPTPTGPVNIEVSDADLEPRTPALEDNGTSVSLTWAEPPGEVDVYVVVQVLSETEATTVGGVVMPPSTSATVEGLDPDATTLCFRVLGLAGEEDGQVVRGVSEPVCRQG